jgi:hypothetical protein
MVDSGTVDALLQLLRQRTGSAPPILKALSAFAAREGNPGLVLESKHMLGLLRACLDLPDCLAVATSILGNMSGESETLRDRMISASMDLWALARCESIHMLATQGDPQILLAKASLLWVIYNFTETYLRNKE